MIPSSYSFLFGRRGRPLFRSGTHVTDCSRQQAETEMLVYVRYEEDNTAWLITLATAKGCAIIDRCPAFTWVICECARCAKKVSSAGGTTWSSIPITAQDGMLVHAGVPEN